MKSSLRYSLEQVDHLVASANKRGATVLKQSLLSPVPSLVTQDVGLVTRISLDFEEKNGLITRTTIENPTGIDYDDADIINFAEIMPIHN